jgi:hypothetical protein
MAHVWAQDNSLPPQFHALLRGSPVEWRKRHYWWRAQSVAYIVRPNARTLAELVARKRRIYPGHQIRPGTLSVHVRHGDKHTEKTPVPDQVRAVMPALNELDGTSQVSVSPITLATS